MSICYVLAAEGSFPTYERVAFVVGKASQKHASQIAQTKINEGPAPGSYHVQMFEKGIIES